jgi:hypothetical protein
VIGLFSVSFSLARASFVLILSIVGCQRIYSN